MSTLEMFTWMTWEIHYDYWSCHVLLNKDQPQWISKMLSILLFLAVKVKLILEPGDLSVYFIF